MLRFEVFFSQTRDSTGSVVIRPATEGEDGVECSGVEWDGGETLSEC